MVTILFDCGPKSDLFDKKGLRMVWFSTKKENICSVTTETQTCHELYMLIELLFTFNVPPRKWQLRVYNSCVLKSGTKMRLLSNSPTGHRSQRGQHLCIHKIKDYVGLNNTISDPAHLLQNLQKSIRYLHAQWLNQAKGSSFCKKQNTFAI